MFERVMIHSQRRIALSALASLLAVGACKDEQCVVSTTQYTSSATAMAVWETPPTPVARFDLTQDFVSHTPYKACAQGPTQDVGVVRAKTTSLWPVPVKLFYDVQAVGSDSVPVWFHYDSILVFKPNETVDLGEIITTPTKLGAVTPRVLVSKIFTLP
jgi:hypothetical protein